MTRQRELVFELVNASYAHPTAEDVFLMAQEAMPGIARATVYNNLNALVGAGKIVRLRTADGADHFDRADHPHGHLICEACGCIHDIDLPHEMFGYFEHTWHIAPAKLEVCGHFRCTECVAAGE